MKSHILLLLMFGLLSSAVSQEKENRCTLSVTVQEKGKRLPCNVRIRDYHGKYWRPDSSSIWKDFNGHVFEEFACDGQFEIALPYGKYEYELDRGPAYRTSTGTLLVNQQSMKQQWQLQQIVDMERQHWFAGETHIHRKPEHIELLMKAADLHIGEVITSWNDNVAQASAIPKPIQQFDGNRYYSITATEDERGGGALLFFNLATPYNFGQQQTEYPPLSASIYKVLNKNKNAWVDLEKPFWPDVPILLATGKINSIGIANNHMLKTGIFDTEAWGKKRDPVKYPSPLGNAYWTQDIYYNILNAGFRIPPSAGSASGVLWNPVGYNRLYAHVSGKFTNDKWWRAVKAGKCFVSNGPLLITTANAQFPGHVFKVAENKALSIPIASELYSRDSVTAIEIIKNGEVYASIDPADIKDNKFSASITFEKSGWFLIRAISTGNNNFRFASTAPFYVEMGKDKKRISKSACTFFIKWLNERQAAIKIENADQLNEVNSYINKSKIFWDDLLAASNAN